MKERPIILSSESVRGVLNGSKTQHRTLVKPALHPLTDAIACHGGEATPIIAGYALGEYTVETVRHCPFGAPGDRLWVRETWWQDDVPDGLQGVAYRADGEMPQHTRHERWRSPIHMPRRFSRLLLELESVRVERVADVSEADAKAEGVDFVGDGAARYGIKGLPSSWSDDPRQAFACAWDRFHAKTGNGWAANPYVWVLAFRRVEPAS